MLGAVIGDIIGSPYEFHNIKTKEFPLFCEKCCFTDDTILSCATAEWLLTHQSPEDMLYKWGKKYKNRTYEDGQIAAFGKGFSEWLETKERGAAKTNGCIMRLSPVIGAFDNKDQALKKALELTAITHNHEESITATKAYIETAFMLKKNIHPNIIKNYITHKYGYDLTKSVEEIRPNYNKFYCSCKNSVPQALISALDATSFEDAIRNAVSLGGDSDTLACMAGGLAEIRFEIPAHIQNEAALFMDQNVLNMVLAYEKRFNKEKLKIEKRLKNFERKSLSL